MHLKAGAHKALLECLREAPALHFLRPCLLLLPALRLWDLLTHKSFLFRADNARSVLILTRAIAEGFDLASAALKNGTGMPNVDWRNRDRPAGEMFFRQLKMKISIWESRQSGSEHDFSDSSPLTAMGGAAFSIRQSQPIAAVANFILTERGHQADAGADEAECKAFSRENARVRHFDEVSICAT